MAVASLSAWEEHLLARASLDPAEYGIDLDKDRFGDIIVEEHHLQCPALSVDELLLRPRTAAAFCDAVRFRHHWWDLPDDILLRTLITRRKNPGR